MPTISDTLSGAGASYAYSAAGQVVRVARANGVDSEFTYDPAGRLEQLAHSTSAGELSVFGYTYDPAGNRTSVTELLQQTSSAPDDLIFADGFESGDFSAWSGYTANNDLQVQAAAALDGDYGMTVVVNDNGSLYVTDDLPASEERYRARFLFDPNSLSMGEDDGHQIFYGYSGESSPIDVLKVQLVLCRGSSCSGTPYRVRAGIRGDNGLGYYTGWTSISDDVHVLEIDWRAALTGSDGGLSFWVDETLAGDFSGVDNSEQRIDQARLGAVNGIDTATRGTYFFDAFESRQESYIGGVGESLLGGMTLSAETLSLLVETYLNQLITIVITCLCFPQGAFEQIFYCQLFGPAA